MFLRERDFHARHRSAGEIARYERYNTGDVVPGEAGAVELPLTSWHHVAGYMTCELGHKSPHNLGAESVQVGVPCRIDGQRKSSRLTPPQ
jgi:hypothetical protein